MYAIVKTGGKEYNVSKGSIIEVEKLNGKIGEEVILDKVLLTADNDNVNVGKPYVDGAQVIAEIRSQKKGKKIIVFKRKPKKGYKKKQGHRQLLTELKIKDIKI
ncbi:MAG: 50S ribosomal protein L21 [bacterium]